jgi:NAD(P)-dependent dehydrogenase (short-subunit alcohol dehydrogenase family)
LSGWLEGKVVVCTGAGSGIGRAAVDAFLSEGAAVGVLERDPAKTADLPSGDGRLFAVTGDATEPAANATLMDEAVRRWGGIDGAVSFVGVFDHYTALVDIADERFEAAFDELFHTNVRSALVTARAALPWLRQRLGSLVLTLSSSSFFAGRGGTLYVATKFALRGVVIELAHEVAPDVRVNGVAPGGTLGTDLRGPEALGLAGQRLGDRPGRREQLVARTPLRVALSGDDHAGAYVFLLSERSRGITGEVIRSDGGLAAR